jgi:hypothetical protein
MIALKKNVKKTKCSNHSTISIIAHTAKIAMGRRTERKIEDGIGDDQFGFREEKEPGMQAGC